MTGLGYISTVRVKVSVVEGCVTVRMNIRVNAVLGFGLTKVIKLVLRLWLVLGRINELGYWN